MHRGTEEGGELLPFGLPGVIHEILQRRTGLRNLPAMPEHEHEPSGGVI